MLLIDIVVMLVIFLNLLNKILKVIDEKGNSSIIYNNKPVPGIIKNNNTYTKSINTLDLKIYLVVSPIAILLKFEVIYMMIIAPF